MLINLTIGEYYKVENKMTGRAVSYHPVSERFFNDGDDRIFEKKDYAFPIIDIKDGSVIVEYSKELYSFEYGYARHNFRPALTYDDIKDFIVLKYITGSKAYGTNVPTSDTDYKAVFIFPDSWYSRFDFNPDWEEIKEKNFDTNEEITYYSLRKFVSLLAVNNPNMLEAFDIPSDCLLYKHPCMDAVLLQPEAFLSKLAYKSFLGYGESQIRKADGQDKLNNWEKADMQRKMPLDFCVTFLGQGSIKIEDWLEARGMEQRFCALNSIDHMRDMYGVYYDDLAHTIVYLKEIIDGTRDILDIKNNPICRAKLKELNRDIFTHDFIDDPARTLEWVRERTGGMLGYKGIVMEDSNDIRLSETPKDAEPICYMSYNKDGYSTHCKLYNRYLTWKKERNEARWTDVAGHEQKIDGKNMLHCMRLIYMSEDIAAGRGIIVRRPEAEYLKSIRYGKVELNELMKTAATKLDELESAFNNSALIDEPSTDRVSEIYDDVIKLATVIDKHTTDE